MVTSNNGDTSALVFTTRAWKIHSLISPHFFTTKPLYNYPLYTWIIQRVQRRRSHHHLRPFLLHQAQGRWQNLYLLHA